MKKRLLSALLALCMMLTLLPSTTFAANGHHPFTDVSDDAWYSSAVQYVYEHGMMTGTNSNGTEFSPDIPTSRGMIVTILHRLEGTPSVSGTAFADVPAGQWYTDAVAWASANEIVNGYGNGNFGPNDPISREQMATILYRYAEYKDYDVSDIVSLSDFTDADAVSDWAETAIKWAVGEGLITGITDTTIAPAGTATRAQAATILMRFCTRIEALQAFQEKDIEDFEGYEIINFDESDETNFAVLLEDTIVSSSTEESNRLVSSDEENGVFVFSNINEQIAGLDAGNVLYITYGDGDKDYLLLKVGSIEIVGDTATITEGEAELSDYFEYIDVDMEVDVNSDNFDTSGADSDVTYEGASEEEPGAPRLFSALSRSGSVGGDASTKFKFGIDTGTISAMASVKLTLSVKIRYDKSIFDIEEIKISVKQENSIEVKLTGNVTGKEDTKRWTLGKATVPICFGLDAEVDVYIFFDLDLSASVTFEVKTTSENGVKFRNGKAEPIDESDYEISLSASGRFNASFGIGMDIGVKALKVLKMSLATEAGVELDAKTDSIGISTDRTERHECALCIDGEVNLFGDLSFKVKLGFTEKRSVTIVDWKLAEIKIHLKDFYISFLNGDADAEFGWGDCPHKQYLVTINVSDQNNSPVSGATVNIFSTTENLIAADGKTGSDGIFSVYVNSGNYRVDVYGLNGYEDTNKTVVVGSNAQAVKVTYKKNSTEPLVAQKTVAWVSDELSPADGMSFGTTTYTYDNNDRVKSESFSDEWDVMATKTDYTYDQNGNVTNKTTTTVYNGGSMYSNSIDYTYNSSGAVLTEVYSSGRSVTYSYDSFGRLVTETQKDTSGTTIKTIYYIYENNSMQPSEIREDYGDGYVSSTFYTYNSKGDKLTETNEYWKYTYTYDIAGRLYKETTTSLSDPSRWSEYTHLYDDKGNEKQRTYSGAAVDGIMGQYYTVETVYDYDLKYDVNGNLVKWTQYMDGIATYSISYEYR